MLAPEALAAAERVAKYGAWRAMRAARVLGQDLVSLSADDTVAARDAPVPIETPHRAADDPPTAASGSP